MEVQFEDRLREEQYTAAACRSAGQARRLTLSGDLSYSESHRTELQKATNMRSGRRVVYTFDGSGRRGADLDFTDFDVTDPANFLIATPGQQHQLRALSPGHGPA